MPDTKKIVSLDVLRGIACMLVWISHIRASTHYFDSSKYDSIQLLGAWGRESVAIFFILSGIVINLSTRNSKDLSLYFRKRFIRIYPIYFAVLVMCFAADHFIMHRSVNLHVLGGNILLSSTLMGYPVPTMPLNPAVWSICCEAFFYIVFGLIFKTNRVRYVWIWFALSCAGIIAFAITDYPPGPAYLVCYVFFNSFLWVTGYLIFEYRQRLQAAMPAVICGIMMIPLVTRLHKLPANLFELCYCYEGIFLVPLFVYLLRNFSKTADDRTEHEPFIIRHAYLLPFYVLNLWLLWQYSGSRPVNMLLYSIGPFASLAFYHPLPVKVFKSIYNKITASFSWMADISYPVYLVHMPLMFIFYYLLPGQKIIGMAAAILLTIILSCIFEIYLFKNLLGSPKNASRKHTRPLHLTENK